MPLLRPGIDVAVHTECRMLSTAAGLDFKQHIILVQARGDRVAALRQWQSVGMVVHFRLGDGFEVPGCPPFCKCMTSPSCSCLRRTPMPRGAQRWPKHGYERLMPAAVAVAEGPPVGRMLALNPRKGRRAPAPLAVHLAEVLRHVEVLVGALMGFRAMRLSGELTPALKQEWEASCRRRAQHLLTHQCPQDPG